LGNRKKIDLKFATINLRDGYPLPALGTPKVNNAAGYAVDATTMTIDGVTGQLAVGDTFTIGTDTDIYTVTAVTNTDSGLVNNAAGYATSATTMTVDGFVGSVAVGNTFKLASHGTVYTITAHTETTGNTTSITFTPGLVDAAVDNDPVTIQNPWTVSITFTPGLANAAMDNDTLNIRPHILEVKIGEGTMTYDEKRKMEYILDRGRLSTVRQGDEEPIDVRFDFIWEFLTAIGSATVPTIEDALKKRGPAANWISSATDQCEPYALDVFINYEPPCTGVDSEQIYLTDFRWEGLNHDFKAGTVAVTGKCNSLKLFQLGQQ
jgi:hypothetical protein